MKRSPYFGGGGGAGSAADEDEDDFEPAEEKARRASSDGGVQCPTHGNTCRPVRTKTGKWLCRCQTPGCTFVKWGIPPQAAYAMLKRQSQSKVETLPSLPQQQPSTSLSPSPSPEAKRPRQRSSTRKTPGRPQLSLVSTEAPNSPECGGNDKDEREEQKAATTSLSDRIGKGGGVAEDLPSFSLQMCAPGKVYARFPKGEKGRQCNAALRGVSGAVWDAQTEAWTFPLSSQAEVVRRLRAAGARVAPVPREVVTAFAAATEGDAGGDQKKTKSEVTDFTALSSDLLAAMFPFQLEGFEFGVRHGGRCMICDEMGLGKTVQAIAIAAHYRRDWPLLVIAPSSLRGNWAAEICRWLPDVAPYQVQVVGSGRDAPRALVNVVSYDLVARLAVAPGQFQTIIADESHYLKNPASIRTRKVVPLLQAARHAVLLTGTPALSRPIELYPQLVALGRPIFASLVRFGRRYCAAFPGPHGWDYSGHSNLLELHALLAHTVMIRRLKAQVLSQLPAKRRLHVPIKADPAFTDSLRDARIEMSRGGGGSGGFGFGNHGNSNGRNGSSNGSFGFDSDGGGGVSDTRPAVTAYFNISAQAKVKPVCEYLKQLLTLRKKFLVFGHHQVMLDGIEALFRGAGIHYIRIDGSTPARQRAEDVARFQSDSSYHAALLSLTAAGTGLTLNAADIVVFAELYWTPGVLMQAEDRAHRIGQQNDVSVHYLVAAGTVDDIIWPLIERKMTVLGETMDGAASHLDHDTVKQAHQSLAALRASAPNVTAPATHAGPSPTLIKAMTEARASGMSRPPPPSTSAASSSSSPCSTPLRGGQRVLTDFFAPASLSAPASSVRATTTAAPKPRVLALDSDDESEVEDVPDDDSSLGFGRLLSRGRTGSGVIVAPATQTSAHNDEDDKDDVIEIGDDDECLGGRRTAARGTPLWHAAGDDADQDESIEDLAPGSQLWVPEPEGVCDRKDDAGGGDGDGDEDDDLLLSDSSVPSFAVTVVKG